MKKPKRKLAWRFVTATKPRGGRPMQLLCCWAMSRKDAEESKSYHLGKDAEIFELVPVEK